MERIACTVFFEDPFWVGVFERTGDDGRYSAAKATFGAEPTNGEVLSFLLDRFYSLTFSDGQPGEAAPAGRSNPKRMQREAARAVSAFGVGTKVQQALKSQYEANKLIHREESRAERDAVAERKFQLHQEKKKAKHRGH